MKHNKRFQVISKSALKVIADREKQPAIKKKTISDAAEEGLHEERLSTSAKKIKCWEILLLVGANSANNSAGRIGQSLEVGELLQTQMQTGNFTATYFVVTTNSTSAR